MAGHWGGPVQTLAVQGWCAYVAYMHDVDCFSISGAVNAVAMVDDLVYVADHFGGLWILRSVPPVEKG